MNAATSGSADRRSRPRPPFWAKLPVLAGNLLQLGGIAAGVLLVVAAAIVRSAPAVRRLKRFRCASGRAGFGC